ncbi:MAG: DSD1 family PLP-dependent enzyme [Acidobacteria bacterium]|nr:DSD1 family PLP-dependent enzyme [Acidobacteriota bacterium]
MSDSARVQETAPRSVRGVRDVGRIPTPALVIDIAAMDRNIQRMATFFADGPCRLRPHFKAHKTPDIARRQLAGGSCTGLTCATVSEAEVATLALGELLADVSGDILIANEPVGPGKCARVATLARRVPVTVAADSVAGLEALDRAATEAGVTIGVLVDLDVGMARCGVPPGGAAVSLGRRVVAARGLRLRGVMGYEGHLVGLADRDERDARTRQAMAGLVETAERFRAEGLPCDVVSAGGTGTYDISGRVDGVTEIQAGSYVLMDSDYARLDLPFEQALWVLGTVISRPTPARCVLDCGHKSMSKDHGYPSVRDVAGAAVLALNDEHATMSVPSDCLLGIGDRVHVQPSHIDPTINLHDVFYVLEGDRVVGVWPIAARGYQEHREIA